MKPKMILMIFLLGAVSGIRGAYSSDGMPQKAIVDLQDIRLIHQRLNEFIAFYTTYYSAKEKSELKKKQQSDAQSLLGGVQAAMGLGASDQEMKVANDRIEDWKESLDYTPKLAWLAQQVAAIPDRGEGRFLHRLEDRVQDLKFHVRQLGPKEYNALVTQVMKRYLDHPEERSAIATFVHEAFAEEGPKREEIAHSHLAVRMVLTGLEAWMVIASAKYTIQYGPRAVKAVARWLTTVREDEGVLKRTLMAGIQDARAAGVAVRNALPQSADQAVRQVRNVCARLGQYFQAALPEAGHKMRYVFSREFIREVGKAEGTVQLLAGGAIGGWYEMAKYNEEMNSETKVDPQALLDLYEGRAIYRFEAQLLDYSKGFQAKLKAQLGEYAVEKGNDLVLLDESRAKDHLEEVRKRLEGIEAEVSGYRLQMNHFMIFAAQYFAQSRLPTVMDFTQEAPSLWEARFREPEVFEPLDRAERMDLPTQIKSGLKAEETHVNLSSLNGFTLTEKIETPLNLLQKQYAILVKAGTRVKGE